MPHNLVLSLAKTILLENKLKNKQAFREKLFEE